MYRPLLAVDANEQRAQSVLDTLQTLPAYEEEVEPTVFHCFTNNPEGASINQVKSVRKIVDALENQDIEFHLMEASGEPAIEIINVADEIDADGIFMAGRKRSATGKVLFGSTTQEVVLNTDRPVMICGQTE